MFGWIFTEAEKPVADISVSQQPIVKNYGIDIVKKNEYEPKKSLPVVPYRKKPNPPKKILVYNKNGGRSKAEIIQFDENYKG